MKSFIIFALSLLLYPVCSEGVRPIKKNISPPLSLDYSVKNYLDSGDRSTEIGIAISKQNLISNKKLPVVVFIHGGGWKTGDKDQNIWQCFNYAHKGYIAITISYRLLDEAPFPQCIIDVKTAIRFIKSLSEDYPIDTENIGVWGYSAGGHLALMIALDDNSSSFDSGLYNEYDNSVKCAAVIAAPTDFSNKERGSRILSKEQWKSDSFKSKISPITYINSKQPSIMMIHGTVDRIVPPYHYKNFADLCMKESIKNFELEEAENHDHMFYFKDKKYPNLVFEYFEKMLKNDQK